MPKTASALTKAPRLLLADDHRMVVKGLIGILEDEFEIAGVAFGGADLLVMLHQHPADCLLLDLEMPGRSGLELIPLIRRLRPDLHILVLTMMTDRQVADACLRAGASGFVPKEADVDELKTAVREVLAGRRYLSPRVHKNTNRVGLNAKHVSLHRLTPRQQQIVLLLGDGKSGVQISRELSVSPSTISFHKHNIMRCLGIVTDCALIRYSVLVTGSEA